MLTALEDLLGGYCGVQIQPHELRSDSRITKNENYDDEDFVKSATFLHRYFLLSIDYFQRQLFYHERYVTYFDQCHYAQGEHDTHHSLQAGSGPRK
jgi:hypothetical protein